MRHKNDELIIKSHASPQIGLTIGPPRVWGVLQPGMDRGIDSGETFQGEQVKAGFGQLKGSSRAASAFEGGRGFGHTQT